MQNLFVIPAFPLECPLDIGSVPEFVKCFIRGKFQGYMGKQQYIILNILVDDLNRILTFCDLSNGTAEGDTEGIPAAYTDTLLRYNIKRRGTNQNIKFTWLCNPLSKFQVISLERRLRQLNADRFFFTGLQKYLFESL